MKANSTQPARSRGMQFAVVILLCGVAGIARAQSPSELPPEITTPDKVESPIGTLEYHDGVPTIKTAERVRDILDFTRALNV
jgi:hypothetical protein